VTGWGDAGRFALVIRVFDILADHPGGMRLDELAARLATSPDALLAEIGAYHADRAVGGALRGGYREPVIEFAAYPDAREAAVDATVDGFVRLRDVRPAAEAGARLVSLGELDRTLRAVRYRLLNEPDNVALAEVLRVLAGSAVSGARAGEPASLAERARPFRRAAAQRRRVHISYAPEWKPGLVERVIEPYQVVHTRRGWEIDAGVVGKEGVVGTFLVGGVHRFDVLTEVFEPPPDVAARIERARRQRPVELIVPHAAGWAVEMYAESAHVLDQDEERIRLRAFVLPPVTARLGLLLLAAGPGAAVVAPAALADAGRTMARDLLQHHVVEPDR
jgi:predicted DNA-binding transcriptional regulator YafY